LGGFALFHRRQSEATLPSFALGEPLAKIYSGAKREAQDGLTPLAFGKTIGGPLDRSLIVALGSSLVQEELVLGVRNQLWIDGAVIVQPARPR
jgi:hypothetical protein